MFMYFKLSEKEQQKILGISRQLANTNNKQCISRFGEIAVYLKKTTFPSLFRQLSFTSLRNWIITVI